MKKPAALLLSNGRLFKGTSFGATGTALGEACFNTSMTGYQEVLTDPSYAGQLVTMTAPQIGNYGVNPEDVESSRIQVGGFIVRECSPVYSNYRATQSLDAYLADHDIVGIQGIDTRALTRIIRSEGAMNGIISTDTHDPEELSTRLQQAPRMEGTDLARTVTCRSPYNWTLSPVAGKRFKVAALDFGIKWSILRLLAAAGCHVTVYPANTPANDLLAGKPDGIFLSNGPGDPAAVTYAIDTVKNLIGKKPLFGICLGHQILALALGARTYKLKFGHRGANHPVRHLQTGHVEITSQNHGFAVDPQSLPQTCTVTHMNLNDETLEGFEALEEQAFSVQYHPEASPGPHDSRYLFKRFTDLMETHA